VDGKDSSTQECMWKEAQSQLTLAEQRRGLKVVWLLTRYYLLCSGDRRSGVDAAEWSDRAIVMVRPSLISLIF
jgi:hypothetical protein